MGKIISVFLTAIVAIMLLHFAGCSDDERTRSTLHQAGFTDVTTTGYQFWACGEDDTFSTGFRATNPQGNRVSGVVCCGWSKGCTIRF